MFIFPYRAQIKLHKIPTVTIVVAVVCLLIYFMQSRNERRVEDYAAQTCERITAPAETEGQSSNDTPAAHLARMYNCTNTFLDIYANPNPQKRLAQYVEKRIGAGDPEGAEFLRSHYQAFSQHAPSFLTGRLWHDRSRFDPIGMITSVFAHGSWDHVVFNLIFFFAFAASVELLVGPVLFFACIVMLSLAIGVFDHAIAVWKGSTIPTLGLSGVVMGMLALFVYFLPRARIRMFFWFMLSVGTIGIPAWILAVWYIGWDFYYQVSGAGGYVNFVAHLTGAAFGFAIGFLFFRSKRHWAKELVLESGSPDLTKEESAFSKLNGILAAPVIIGFTVLGGVLLITLAVMLIERVWVVMLLAAPALLAAYQIYKSRKSELPQRDEYQRGIDAINQHHFATAIKILEPLAQKNDTRALFALAGIHAAGKGVPRDDMKAAQLYLRAAQRNHPQSLFTIAALYADGRGIPRDMTKAIQCYEKAAQAGLPDAANSLGYLYETGSGVPADMEKAIDWYVRAGVGYQKAKRLEDLNAVVRQLESFVGRFPRISEVVVKLKGREA